ncbi:cell envelope integrity protein TolA [Tenacibaculum sp. 190524A05c]|uniref:cell envelope integrity protein TolA n=1 Tax=Tenacibaculum platacis TaxID=3137852 RepID=UPI0031FB8F44
MVNLKFKTKAKRFTTLVIITFLSLCSFKSVAQGGGTQVKSTTVAGTHSIENGSFNYTATVIYQLHDAGYGDDPSAIRLGVKNFKITRLNLRMNGADEVIRKKSFPMTLSDVNVDIDGNLTLRRGNNRYSLNVSKTGITAKNNFNAFNSYDFGKSNNTQIQKIFGEDVSYNDLDFILNNVNLRVKTSYFSFISDIKSEIRNNERRKQKEKEDKIREEEIAKRKKEEAQKVEESNSYYSQPSSNSQAKKEAQLREQKRQQELDRKRREEQKKIDDYNRFRRQQEAELKRKQTENKAIADAATGLAGMIAGGASDGIFSGINLGLTSRTYDTGESGVFSDGKVDILSYELGISIERGGFTMGYVDSGEGGFLVGLDYDILQLDEIRYDRYSVRVNLSGEFGFGDETFYGAFLNVRIFEILYVGYGLGQVEVDETDFSGSYDGFRIGVHFNF